MAEAQTESDWIKSGTDDAEPVTVSTPEAEVVETEAVEVVEESPDDLVVTEVEATEEVAAETEAEAVVQAMLEGRLGDEAYEYPEGLLVPIKRGDETEFVPIADALKALDVRSELEQREADLQRDRSTFGRDRASYGREVDKLEAKEKFLAEREQEVRSALSNPESARKFEEHLHMMESNPQYKAVFDRDWSNVETELERDQLRAAHDDILVQEAVQETDRWLDGLSGEFPDVDKERVRVRFGQELSSSYDAQGRVIREATARLDQADVRRIFVSEAAYLASARGPLETRVDELSAKIASLIESDNADQHNETTQHALERAKAKPVATGAGAPARSPTPPTRFGPQELAERNSEWVKAGA